jgi:SEC-C motif-containing protein
MRSRYSAYSLRNSPYLLASWDINTRPASIDFSQETAVWEKLEILHCAKGGLHDTKGTVEFKAYYAQAGLSHVLHETSRFKKTHARWFYLDGKAKILAPATIFSQPSPAKNALCTCGSGKKYKRCCGVQ